MRHLGAWAVWFAVLWWFWFLLVGEWNRYEWIAATVAAAIGATIAEIARTRAEVRLRVPLHWIVKSWSALPMVAVDFGIVMWVLLRKRTVRGSFRTRPAPARGTDPKAVGIRAWVTILADYSPNAYVVDIDREGVLLHELVPYRRSEEPA